MWIHLDDVISALFLSRLLLSIHPVKLSQEVPQHAQGFGRLLILCVIDHPVQDQSEEYGLFVAAVTKDAE